MLALEKEEFVTTHNIPVVLYEDGQRKVVGNATVNVDGDHVAVLAEVKAEYAKQLGFEIKQISMGPISRFHKCQNEE